MLFNSYEFIFLFLPVVFFGYFLLNRYKLVLFAKSFLFFGSLFFYSYWSIAYLPLLLGSILFNYTVANQINLLKDKRYKKSIFIFGVVVNLGFLGYFKYMDFFIKNINFVFSSNIELLHLALPLAISFFTLQQVAFLVDSFQGTAKEQKFIDYAIFVSFFPQLIAGPIVHHQHIMPQFQRLKNKFINYKNIALGIYIFSIGLFKKVVIADTFATWANYGFDEATTLNFFEAWATSLSYTFELYFDFSGYADMAIGLGLLFNIRLPINFNSPLKATNIIDFWARWHMTLTKFITNYMFMPLLKALGRVTFNKSLLVTFITMVVIGFWHGAGWTFIIYGAIHGIALIINHIFKKKKIKLHKFISWFITFNFVNFAFTIFRAKEIKDAIKVWSGMVDFSNMSFTINYLEALIIGVAFFVILKFRNSSEIYNDKSFSFNFKDMILFVLFFAISIFVMRLRNATEFLYFNF